MKVIGLTGGIGSGKSTVANTLKALGAGVIDADRIGHQILLIDGVRKRIVSVFGQNILDPKDQINRQLLGELVFSDERALKQLNDITHPEITKRIKSLLEKYRHSKAPMIVIEATLLAKAGWLDWFDEIWVTEAPTTVVLGRVIRRFGITLTAAKARINCQPIASEYTKIADVLIDTNKPLTKLKTEVTRLYHERK
jgi:dephospho-CoA kinase